MICHEKARSQKALHSFDYHNIQWLIPTPNQINQQTSFEDTQLHNKMDKKQYTQPQLYREKKINSLLIDHEIIAEPKPKQNS